MAITFLKRSELPEPTKGKVGTNSVAISDNGQIVMSSIASKFFAGVDKAFVAFDGTKVYLLKPDAPIVVSAMKKKMIGENDFVALRRSKKDGKEDPNGQVAFSASRYLSVADKYGASVNYDFRASGNQTFQCSEDEAKGYLMFEIPASGKLTPKPVVARKKKAPASVKAEAGSTVAINEVKEEELLLETA